MRPVAARDDLRELGLADARRPLDQHRLLELVRQEDDGRDLAIADVALLAQLLLDLLHGFEHARTAPWRGSGLRPAAPFATPQVVERLADT